MKCNLASCYGLDKQKRLYFAFVNFEKAFGRVSSEVVQWALRKLGEENWLFRVVQSMYRDA